MLRNIRSSHLSSAFKLRLSILLSGLVLLGAALPLWAQVITAQMATDFGTVAIGRTSAATPLTLTFVDGETIGSPVALTEGAPDLDFAVASGGTCAAGTYSAGDTCTVNVTFTPKFAGARNGAVLLTDGGGQTIATAYVHGIGSGPQVSFLPGSQSTLGFFWGGGSLAVDGSGNVFVTADSSYESMEELVYEIPAGCTASSCVKTIGSGFSNKVVDGDFTGALSAIAVDGGGDVFVADNITNAVYEIPYGCTSSGCIKTLGGGFGDYIAGGIGYIAGIAVDSSGDVFITEVAAGYVAVGVVKEIPSGCATASCVKALGGGFGFLGGIAVDGSGNVFVTDDAYRNVVKEIPVGCVTASCVKTLGVEGYLVAVDGRGNLFLVSDAGLQENPSGCVAASCVRTLEPRGNGDLGFGSIAVDGSGNVFFTWCGHGGCNVVKFDYVDAPSLSFGTIGIGTVSAEQTVTVQNIGNAPLTLPVSTAVSNPSVSPYFTLDSSAATACPVVPPLSEAESLAPGASCTLSISFEPTVLGNITGSVLLRDNALNAASRHYATQTIALQGAGGHLTTTTVAVTSPVPFETPTTFTATVSSKTAGSITGTVTFQVGSATLGTSTIGTAPVSGGTATLTVQGFSINIGSNSVTAAYGGDSNFVASSGSTTLTVLPMSYTLAASPNSITIPAESSAQISLNLATINYFYGTVSFATSVSSTNGTPSAIQVYAPSCNLGTSTESCMMTIGAATSAAKHPPAAPWKGGGALMLCAVLLGAPFGLRRRAIAVLLAALAISVGGFLIACGGGSSSSTSTKPAAPKAPRTYTVTVTPTGTGQVTDPPPVVITVTVT